MSSEPSLKTGEPPLPQPGAEPPQALPWGSSEELAWRVLALVNLFRQLIPLLLMVLYWTLEPRLVGQANAQLFFFTSIAYFLFAALSIPSLKRRWPDLLVQTALNVSVDVLAISLLTYSSGGMSS